MQNVKTRNSTHNFQKPANWDTEKFGECGDLLVRAQTGEGDVVQLVSTWKPSAAELAHLNRGGVIEMLLCTVSQPPCTLYVVDPVEARFVIDDKPALTINEEAHGFGHDEHGPATP
jgi:hypothetical protein